MELCAVATLWIGFNKLFLSSDISVVTAGVFTWTLAIPFLVVV
jgi:hypothetical protein